MTEPHPLDRPVWNALTTRQSHLALGGAGAIRFDPDYGVFAACVDHSPENLAALVELIPANGEVWIVEATEMPILSGATVLRTATVHQMTASAVALPEPAFPVVPLTEEDAPEMLALALLTEPGPFFGCTHRLGDFIGVKENGRLVAMAGERMKPEGFTEVSGVCTHPDHRGRGYAGALMRIVAARILERGETPFLHVYANNVGAIALYETLGFSLRRPIGTTILGRADASKPPDLPPTPQPS